MTEQLKRLVLFCLGGLLYLGIEILYRGFTHWSMFIVGGICFVMIGEINERFSWEMPIWLQGIIGAAEVTVIEFLSGCVLNIWLGWNVWDYSDMPCNLLGQVCLPFSIAWFFVAIIAIVVDDWLRYRLFGEEKPKYTL